MPGGDGTGPEGRGPMTGRGAGPCAGYETPGWPRPMPVWGRGRGGGRGRWMGPGYGRRGWRSQYYAAGEPNWAGPAYGPPMTQEQEVVSLKEQAEWLKDQLDGISQRLEELVK